MSFIFPINRIKAFEITLKWNCFILYYTFIKSVYYLSSELCNLHVVECVLV